VPLQPTTDGQLQLTGELDFKTVPLLAVGSEHLFDNGEQLDVDLGGVGRADSAGVALLIEWQRQALHQNKSIVFHNVPSQMLAIARLSGVDDLLSLNT